MRSWPLVVGDSLVLLAFSLGGLLFHDVPGQPLSELARIGLPFTLGYFLVAHLLGALSAKNLTRGFIARSTAAWLLGIGLGVLLRIAVEGRVPIAAFVIVTFVFTGVLLLGWRSVYWLLIRRQGSGRRGQQRKEPPLTEGSA